MPLYKCKGSACGSTFSVYAPASSPPTTASCPLDACKAKRVFTVPSIPKPFEPHFNHSIGKYVRSMAEFKSALSKGSDDASERLGMDHKYAPVDLQDMPHTDDGLESQERARRDSGLTAARAKIII